MMMRDLDRFRRLMMAVVSGGLMLLLTARANAQPDPNKVLRFAFEVAETSMDPQKVSDVYSSIVNNAVFDSPLRYDVLARPTKLIPNTLVAMPEVSADYRTLTLRLKPGIYFDNHEAFGDKKKWN